MFGLIFKKIVTFVFVGLIAPTIGLMLCWPQEKESKPCSFLYCVVYDCYVIILLLVKLNPNLVVVLFSSLHYCKMDFNWGVIHHLKEKRITRLFLVNVHQMMQTLLKGGWKC